MHLNMGTILFIGKLISFKNNKKKSLGISLGYPNIRTHNIQWTHVDYYNFPEEKLEQP